MDKKNYENFRFFFTVSIHEVSCPWGEMSMGRVVRGANCPWGELSVGRIVRGTNCLWGELSMGRTVRGAKCPWGEMSWGELSWGDFSWGEFSWGELSWGEFDGASGPGNVVCSPEAVVTDKTGTPLQVACYITSSSYPLKTDKQLAEHHLVWNK